MKKLRRTPAPATVRDDTKLRPLNAPRAIVVRADEAGVPKALAVTSPTGSIPIPGRSRQTSSTLGRLRSVERIQESWRIDDEWWRVPISRLYYTLVLEGGAWVTLYRDLEEGGWYTHGQ